MAADVEDIRFAEHVWVSVGGADEEGDKGGGWDGAPLDVHVLEEDALRELDGSGEAEELVDGGGRVDLAVSDEGELVGCLEEGEHAVPDEVRGGLEAGDEEEHGEGHDLVMGEGVAFVASQSEGASSGSVADATVRSSVMLAPAAGTYTYATRGYNESGSGPTRRRSDLPATTTDHVDVTTHERGKTVTITTDFGDGSTQHVVLEVTETEVHLTRLASTSTTAGVRSEQAVNPQPPILVVRPPYRVGDTWESWLTTTSLRSST